MRFRYAEIFSNMIHGPHGNVSALILTILQDRNQLLWLSRKPPEVWDSFFEFWKGRFGHERSIGRELTSPEMIPLHDKGSKRIKIQ
jgi:hypothetical protein